MSWCVRGVFSSVWGVYVLVRSFPTAAAAMVRSRGSVAGGARPEGTAERGEGMGIGVVEKVQKGSRTHLASFAYDPEIGDYPGC